MIEIDFTVRLESPLRVGAGVGQAGYLDNTVVRDQAGRAYLPGSSLKGKARAVAYRLASGLGVRGLHPAGLETAGCPATRPQPCLICSLFGAAQWEGEWVFENAGLHLGARQMLDNLDQAARRDGRRPAAALRFGQQVRTSLALDRRQRVSLPGRLFTYELVGNPVVFSGRIYSAARSLPQAGSETALLAAALGEITHLGGGRGRGLGRCQVQITQIRSAGSIYPLAELLEFLPQEGR